MVYTREQTDEQARGRRVEPGSAVWDGAQAWSGEGDGAHMDRRQPVLLLELTCMLRSACGLPSLAALPRRGTQPPCASC